MKLSTPHFALACALVLTACADDKNKTTALPIDVKSISISGDFSLNANPFPASLYESGIIALADASQSSTELGKTYNNEYEAQIIVGEYSTQYHHAQGGNLVPVNNGNQIESAVSLLQDQTLNINTTAHQVQFMFTLNSGSFPASEYDDALFYLQHIDGGERILVGNSHAAVDPVWLMPGEYDIIYSVQTPGAIAPLNQNAILERLDITSSMSVYTVNVVSTEFRLTATLNGQPFPQSEYNDGVFWLYSENGDIVKLGKTHDLPVSINVIESTDSTYNIVYSHETGNLVPANKSAVVLSNLAINSTNNNHISLDIETVEITPSYTLDGEKFQTSEYQDANIYLRGAAKGDEFLLGNTHEPVPQNVRIIPGTYDVLYRHETGDQVPQNKNAMVIKATALNNDQTLHVAVESATAVGSFFLNGQLFPNSPSHYGRFFLVGPESDDKIFLGNSNDGAGFVKVVANTYDVIYERVTGNQVPANTRNTIVSGVAVAQSTSIPVDVKASSVTPAFTLNGKPFPATLYEHARFFMRGEEAGDEVYLGRSFFTPTSVLAIDGSYDIFYEYKQGANIPVNTRKRVGGLVLN